MLSYKLFNQETLEICTSLKGDFAALASGGKVSVYKVSDQFDFELIDKFKHRDVSHMRFNHCAEVLYFLDTSGRFYRYDIYSNKIIEIVQSSEKDECFDKIVLLPDGDCVWGANNKLIKFCNEECKIKVIHKFESYRISSIYYSVKNDTICVMAFDRKLKRWVEVYLTPDGNVVGEKTILDKKVTSAEFIRCPKFEQGYYFRYSNWFQNKIFVFNKECESVLSIKLNRNAVENISISEDEQKVAVSYFSDDSVYLYSLKRGELLAVFDTSKLLGEEYIPSFFMDFALNDKALIVNGFTMQEQSKTFLFDIKNPSREE